MKKLISFFLAASLVLSCAGCGDVLVDFDTPKSEELMAEYDFYPDSQKALSSGMAITPEQADEVFIILVSCGMEKKVTNVTRKQGDNGHCQVSSGLYVYDVYYTNGIVDSVSLKGEELYPAPDITEEEPTDVSTENIADTLEQAIDNAIESARAEKENVNILDAASVGEIGDGSIIEIYLKGKDNLSVKLIRNGMWMQANDIMKSLQNRTDFQEIRIFWSFSLIDAYGNPFEDTVMKVIFEKETLDKINFDSFVWSNIPDIADEYYQHVVLSD